MVRRLRIRGLAFGVAAAVAVGCVRQPSAVVDWNEAMLAAVRSGPPRPTVIARALYIVQAAEYDAWSLYDAHAIPTALDASLRRPASERTDANKRAAVAQAAYQALVALFPTYEAGSGAFATLLAQEGYEPSGTANTTTPDGIGRAAALAVLAQRATDGSNAAGNFADATSAKYPTLYAPVNSADPSAAAYPGKPGFDPNRWQPLRVPTGKVLDAQGFPVADDSNPASYTDQKFLTPHWGAVTPFALLAGDALRPPPPPRKGSNAPYTDATGKTTTEEEAVASS